MPFLAPKRLVIVQDLFTNGGKLDKKFMTVLVDYLSEMPDTARLFFMESKALSAKHAILKLAANADVGYAKLFDRPQGAQLERWIMQHAAELGGQMHPRAANMLAINVGNDLALLGQEVQKLVMYKGITEPVAQIMAEDVSLLSPYAAESNIFDLVDAVGNRNGKQAAELLQQKLGEGAEPFLIFSMIVRQFRLLIQVKELAETGLRAPAISKELKLHSFVAGKVFQQSQSFSLTQLEQIYAHLLDVDVRVKTGKTDMITALNLLVFGLAVG
jgi:DNA polymerase-3 subunit delta